MATAWEDSLMIDAPLMNSISTADYLWSSHVTAELQRHDFCMFFVSQASDTIC